jgi:succinate dehydrogenase / fumarate reductase membrane anchor subunit
VDIKTLLHQLQEYLEPKRAVHHWWLQRATAVILVPLSLWFMFSLAAKAGAGHAVVVDWIGSPLVALFLIALILTLCYHALLGVQVVLDDYVHDERIKTLSLKALNIAMPALAVIATLTILKIFLFGAE